MTKSKKRTSEAELAAKELQKQLETNDDAYNQRLFRLLRLLVHVLASLQFSYGVYYHYFKVQRVHDETAGKSPQEVIEIERWHWGGKFKYLTFLDAILQAVYHSLALLNDLFGCNEVVPKSASSLRRLRDYIFAALAMPIAANVCISFWVIYAYDRELIFPSELDAIFPNWLNHIVHTNVAMMIIMDMFTCFRQYPSRNIGISGTLTFMLIYVVWIHIVKHNSGFWVYPILEVLNMPMRYVMLSALVGVTVLLYYVGEFLNGVIWGQELKLLKQKELKGL